MRCGFAISSVRRRGRRGCGYASTLLVGLLLTLASCSTVVEDMPELSNATLCDIVAHRDESGRVRRAAEEELDSRGVECDRLAAVIAAPTAQHDALAGPRRHRHQSSTTPCTPTATACSSRPATKPDKDQIPVLPIRLRNSLRVFTSRRNWPSITEVVITEFCFSTPRIIMHRCCASITQRRRRCGLRWR